MKRPRAVEFEDVDGLEPDRQDLLDSTRSMISPGQKLLLMAVLGVLCVVCPPLGIGGIIFCLFVKEQRL